MSLNRLQCHGYNQNSTKGMGKALGGGGGRDGGQSHPHCNLEVAALTSSKEI